MFYPKEIRQKMVKFSTKTFTSKEFIDHCTKHQNEMPKDMRVHIMAIYVLLAADFKDVVIVLDKHDFTRLSLELHLEREYDFIEIESENTSVEIQRSSF